MFIGSSGIYLPSKGGSMFVEWDASCLHSVIGILARDCMTQIIRCGFCDSAFWGRLTWFNRSKQPISIWRLSGASRMRRLDRLIHIIILYNYITDQIILISFIKQRYHCPSSYQFIPISHFTDYLHNQRLADRWLELIMDERSKIDRRAGFYGEGWRWLPAYFSTLS